MLLGDDGALDVAEHSQGRFGPDPQSVFAEWNAFRRWAQDATSGRYVPFDQARLGPPAPRPRQVFAVGLNYRDHAHETGFAVPEGAPPVFTKFPSCLTGPYGTIALPSNGNTDWEVELVAVIGRRVRCVPRSEAWAHVAGLTIGQDLSERISQMAGSSPQFSLAKSLPGFGPVGPYLVTPDELADPADLAIETELNGEIVQSARTSQLIFDVPTIIERLSAVAPLLPGDIIFTGTPAGVGLGRTPPRWLKPGDELVSRIEGLGEMRHRFIAECGREEGGCRV